MRVQSLLSTALVAAPSLAKPIAQRASDNIVHPQFIPEILPTSSTGVSIMNANDDQSPNCMMTYNLHEGDTCQKIGELHDLPMSSVEANSPADSTTCRDLLTGYRICIDIVPSSIVQSATSAIRTTSQTITAAVSSRARLDQSIDTLTASLTITKTSLRVVTFTARTGSAELVGTTVITRTFTDIVDSTTTATLPGSHAATATGSKKFAKASKLVSRLSKRPLNTSSATHAISNSNSKLLLTTSKRSTTRAFNTTTKSFFLTGTTTALGPFNIATTVLFQRTTGAVAVTTNATVTSTSMPTSTSTLAPLDVYKAYSGNGSVAQGWPSMADWVDFEYMFNANAPNMKSSCQKWGVPNDTEDEVASLKSSIQSVGASTGVDPRFILAIVMQESTGCVRVITTSYSLANPGLMQSFNGTGSCNSDNAQASSSGVAGAGGVLTPCPASQIKQMIEDGTAGTASGPGLKQNYKTQGLTGAIGYYRTARIYNGGSLVADDLSQPCCTASYATDVANRLTGWVNAPRT